MNINDRDLTIIGAGAFLTIVCLLFQWPFTVRIVLGLLVLVIFTIVALARLGDDRIPLEQYLMRRFGRENRPRKFSYRAEDHQGQKSAPVPGTTFKRPEEAGGVETVPSQPLPAVPAAAQAVTAAPDATEGSQAAPTFSTIEFAWEEFGLYRLVTIWLAVIGLYFVYWLFKGGSAQIGQWMRTTFNIP